MSIGKKHIIRYYTIVEVMVAMAIFLVMMTIMMQFFNSAQKVWNASSKRNMMYADARVAMNLMTRELQSMLYRNDAVDGTAIYPFWFEWTDVDVDAVAAGGSVPVDLEDYWVDNNDLPEQVIGATPQDAYLTALNFIATTDIKSVDKGSNVCEIRYKFIPAYYTDSTPESVNDVRGGYLQRSCVEEYTDINTPANTTTVYNFAQIPYDGASTSATRVEDIWPLVPPTSAPFRTVISGVYSLKFTCYMWFVDTVPTQSRMMSLAPMNRINNGEDTADNAITDDSTITNPPYPYIYDLANGTHAPIAVRVDMKLLDPKDLKKLIYNIYAAQNGTAAERSDAARQIRALKQKLRSFSKVIYIGQRD